jgi:hypothetical protein
MRWMDDYCCDLFLCSTNNNLQVANITKQSNPSILVKGCKKETKNRKALENESTWNETKTRRITNNVIFFLWEMEINF